MVETMNMCNSTRGPTDERLGNNNCDKIPDTLLNSISFTLTLSAVNYTDEVSLFINSVVRPLAPRFSKLHLAIIYL